MCNFVHSFQIFSSIEESHTCIDKSLLPKEYGGEMEMSTMIGEFIFNTHNLIINIYLFY